MSSCVVDMFRIYIATIYKNILHFLYQFVHADSIFCYYECIYATLNAPSSQHKDLISSSYITRSWIVGSCIYNSWRNLYNNFHILICIPPIEDEAFLLDFLSSNGYHSSFWENHFNKCKVMQSIFIYGLLCVLFLNVSLCPYLISICCLFSCYWAVQ